MSEIENDPSENPNLKRGPGNPDWVKGGPSPNPGGRPRKLREIELMLDEEHRTVENMREVFQDLKRLGFKEQPKTLVTKKGEVIETTEPPDPAFAKLYLERVMGPVRELMSDSEIAAALREAPPEVVEWFNRELKA